MHSTGRVEGISSILLRFHHLFIPKSQPWNPCSRAAGRCVYIAHSVLSLASCRLGFSQIVSGHGSSFLPTQSYIKKTILFYYFIFAVLGFELRAYSLSHSTSSFFVMGFFEIRSNILFAWGWLQTSVLLISASWVARIIGMSHQCPADFIFLFSVFSWAVTGEVFWTSVLSHCWERNWQFGFYLF
jgi:hypothetical protein